MLVLELSKSSFIMFSGVILGGEKLPSIYETIIVPSLVGLTLYATIACNNAFFGNSTFVLER